MKNNILLLLVFVFIGCKQEIKYRVPEIPMDTIVFNSFKLIKQFPENIIQNKQYINISIDDKKLLFGEIDRIIISGQRIYIMDSRAKVLAVFDSLGKGIGNIGSVGRGPAEYMNISYFSISSSGNVCLIDGRQDKLNVYDENFNFVCSRKFSFEADILYCLPDGGYLVGMSSWNQGENAGAKVIQIDSGLSTKKIYFDYDKNVDDDSWWSHYCFEKVDTMIFYNRPLDNIVYQFLENGKLERGYYFDFGSYEVSEKAKKEIEKYKVLYQNTYALVLSTIVDESYIVGRILDSGIRKNFLIDRKKNTVYMEAISLDNSLGNIVGYTEDKRIISCLAPGDYAAMEHELQLPDSVKMHLEDGGFTLCLYNIK